MAMLVLYTESNVHGVQLNFYAMNYVNFRVWKSHFRSTRNVSVTHARKTDSSFCVPEEDQRADISFSDVYWPLL